MPISPRELRRRDRWFPWLTLGVAVLWAVAGYYMGSQVKEANTARLCGSLMLGAAGQSWATTNPDSFSPGSGKLPALPGFAMLLAAPSAANSGSGHSTQLPPGMVELQRATAIVETVASIWMRGMYGVAAILALVGVISRATGRPRWPHLFAAAVVLLATGATLAAMAYLGQPHGGALPPLPIRTFVLAGIALSAYAWIVLIAYLRPARRGQIADM